MVKFAYSDRPWSPSVDSRYSFPPLDPMTLKDKRNKYLSTESLKINRFDSKNDCIRFGYSTSALKFDILLYLQYKRVNCLTRRYLTSIPLAFQSQTLHSRWKTTYLILTTRWWVHVRFLHDGV